MSNYTWIGPSSGGTWNNHQNWVGGSNIGYPETTDDTANFFSTTSVSLGDSITVGNINVSAGLTVIGTSSQTLTVGTFDSGSGTVVLDVNTNVTSSITGNGTFEVNGSTLNISSTATSSASFLITNGGTLNTLGNTNNTSITFGAGNNNTLSVPNNAGIVLSPITGVAIGDKIVITGGGTDTISSITPSAPGSDQYSIIVSNNGGFNSVVLNTVTLPAGVTATMSNNVLTFVSGTPCFLEGTLLATPSGQVAVEAIRIGDLVTTLVAGQHVTKPVTWVGHRAVKPGELLLEEAHPIRIKAGAFAENMPVRDLLVNPEHCIFFENALLPARLLVNGRSIIIDTSIVSFTYYHVELETHAILLAEGLATESYMDSGNRSAFANADLSALRPRLSGNTGGVQAAAPLAVKPDQVRLVWAMLNARAEGLGLRLVITPPVLTHDPDLRILASGVEIRPFRQNDDKYMFAVPAGETSLTLLSRAARPCDMVGPFIDDRRVLGVLVGQISLHEGRRKQILRKHLTAAALSGWHGVEFQTHRWTNGKACLPVDLSKLHASAAILEIPVVQSGPYRLTAPLAVAA